MVTVAVEVGDRLAQFGQAHRGGVRQRTSVVLFAHGVTYCRRGAEVRLAQAQLDDVGAVGDHLIGQGSEDHGTERIGDLRAMRHLRPRAVFSVSHASVSTTFRVTPSAVAHQPIRIGFNLRTSGMDPVTPDVPFVHDFVVEAFQSFVARLFAEFAFPDHDDVPSVRFEFGVLPHVAFAVAQQFGGPEFHVRFRDTRGFRASFVHVPEATVDEHQRMVFRQHHIRMAGVSLVVFAESQAFGEQEAAHHAFDGCVLAADVGHGIAARAAFVFFGPRRFPGLRFAVRPLAISCRHGFPL